MLWYLFLFLFSQRPGHVNQTRRPAIKHAANSFTVMDRLPRCLLLLWAMWSCGVVGADQRCVVVVERAVVMVLGGRSLLCSAIVQCCREEEK